MKLSNRDLEQLVKEMLSEHMTKMKESDLVYKDKKDWVEAKKDLKIDMGELIDNIESDDYPEGVKKIDQVLVAVTLDQTKRLHVTLEKKFDKLF